MHQFIYICAVVCSVIQIKAANLQGPCKGTWDGYIDNAFLGAQREFITEGYVGRGGGVFIGRQLDLQTTDENTFTSLGVPEDIIAKLRPYFGLKGRRAAAKLEQIPLSLDKDEATTLSMILLNADVSVIGRDYNNDVQAEGDPNLRLFEALTMAQRTVIVSIHYDDGFSGFPVFWHDAVNQNWNKVQTSLGRVNDGAEAQLLADDTGSLTVQGQSCADPHLRTFDGLKYNYQGFCSYVLTQSVDNAQFPAFQVSANFSGLNNPEKPVTRMVDISLVVDGSLVVKMYQDNSFEISGKRYAKSWSVIGDGIGDVYIDDNNVYVEMSKPKLLLTWSGHFHKLIIRLDDDRMYGNVAGLLGDADGLIHNDLRKPDGTLTTDIVEFGDSWVIPGSCN